MEVMRNPEIALSAGKEEYKCGWRLPGTMDAFKLGSHGICFSAVGARK